MNFLLGINPDVFNKNLLDEIGAWETLAFGAEVVLLGMATIFGVLMILWIALTLFKTFLGHENSKSTVQIVEAAPVVEAPKTNDEEIIAVIAAAIAMAESEAPSGVKFRVVGFRRK